MGRTWLCDFSSLPSEPVYVACLLLSCCSHRTWHLCGQLTATFLFLCCLLSCVRVEAEGFQQRFQKRFLGVLAVLILTSMNALAFMEFTIQQFLGKPAVWQANMSTPVKLRLHLDGLDAWQAGMIEDLGVRHLV